MTEVVVGYFRGKSCRCPLRGRLLGSVPINITGFSSVEADPPVMFSAHCFLLYAPLCCYRFLAGLSSPPSTIWFLDELPNCWVFWWGGEGLVFPTLLSG